MRASLRERAGEKFWGEPKKEQTRKKRLKENTEKTRLVYWERTVTKKVPTATALVIFSLIAKGGRMVSQD